MIVLNFDPCSQRYDVANEEKEQAELGDFMRNVLRHKDDFRWIEKNADREHLGDGIVRYEKDIEPRIRERQVSSIRHAPFENDLLIPNYFPITAEETKFTPNNSSNYLTVIYT